MFQVATGICLDAVARLTALLVGQWRAASILLLLLGPVVLPAQEPEPVHEGTELGAWGIDLQGMKTSVDPGDDFYRFVNGAWLETTQIPNDEVSWGSFNILRDRSRERVRAILEELSDADHEPGTIEQKIGDYYASFMNVEGVSAKGLEPLRPLLDEIVRVSSHGGVIRLFGASVRKDLQTPISFSVNLDRLNPDRWMLNIRHSGLGLPDRSYYLEDTERFRKIRSAYRSHIARMLRLAGVEKPDEKAQAILEAETAIAEVHWPREELRDRRKTYNPYSLEGFQKEFSRFDWTGFFEAAGIPQSDIERLNVRTPNAIEPLIEIVLETPVETWKAYLTFHAITNHAEVLSSEIYDAHFGFFDSILNGQPEQKPRWERAIDFIGAGEARGFNGTGLSEAIGRIYVERYFPPEAKEQMEQLVENLRAAFRFRIERLEWMGEDTRKEALGKLEAFHPKIAYPDKWRDFSALTIVPDDLMANARSVRDFIYAEEIARLGVPADRNEWGMSPQTVNAYYNSSWNEIVFPAAILQPPFFDPHADPAVNYGGIGAVIGHEMGHGFDDQGSRSDARGVQRNWWTEEDRERFDERTRALAAQYDQYEPIEGETVNGRLTLGENIGDLGGLSIALEAYRISLQGREPPILDGLTGTQRLYLGWGQVWRAKRRDSFVVRLLKSDPHSPPEFRVVGVVRNMDTWYEAFEVTEDDDLYLPPEERVRIW